MCCEQRVEICCVGWDFGVIANSAKSSEYGVSTLVHDVVSILLWKNQSTFSLIAPPQNIIQTCHARYERLCAMFQARAILLCAAI